MFTRKFAAAALSAVMLAAVPTAVFAGYYEDDELTAQAGGIVTSDENQLAWVSGSEDSDASPEQGIDAAYRSDLE